MGFGVVRAKVVEVREGQSPEGEAGERYEFRAEISNNLLDSYYTFMEDDSLRNFVRDAKTGVTFLEGHDNRRLGYGRVFRGKYEELDDRNRVMADIYTLRGIAFGGLTYASTDDFIRAVDGGLASDVSVGFYDALFRCSLCERDIWDFSDWDDMCPHLPGYEYDDSYTDGEEMCIGAIEGARLAEVSLVYSGATPEAKIEEKAKHLFERGLIGEKWVLGLNARYNLRMAPGDWEPNFSSKRSYFDMSIKKLLDESGIENLPGDGDDEARVKWLIGRHKEVDESQGKTAEERDTAVQERDKAVEERDSAVAERDKAVEEAELNEDLIGQSEALRGDNDRLKEENETLTTRNEKLEEARKSGKRVSERLTAVESERDELQGQVEERDVKITELEGKVEESEELTTLGKEARDALIDEAVKVGARALGDKFNEEERRERLSKKSLSEIKEQIEDWELVGDKRFPGGRKTEGGNDGDPEGSDPQSDYTPEMLRAFNIRA